MGGHPIGWQPRRPGTLRAFHGGGSINIYHKEVHNNYGPMFPMPNYGYAVKKIRQNLPKKVLQKILTEHIRLKLQTKTAIKKHLKAMTLSICVDKYS